MTNPSPRIIQHFSRVWQGYPQSQLACSIPHLFVQRFWLGEVCRSGLSLINRSWWSWSCVWANLQSLPQDLDIYHCILAYLRLQSTSASTIQAFDSGFKLPHVRLFLEYFMTGFGYKNQEASKVFKPQEPQCEHLNKDAASSLGRCKRLSACLSSTVNCPWLLFPHGTTVMSLEVMNLEAL